MDDFPMMGGEKIPGMKGTHNNGVTTQGANTLNTYKTEKNRTNRLQMYNKASLRELDQKRKLGILWVAEYFHNKLLSSEKR